MSPLPFSGGKRKKEESRGPSTLYFFPFPRRCRPLSQILNMISTAKYYEGHDLIRVAVNVKWDRSFSWRAFFPLSPYKRK